MGYEILLVKGSKNTTTIFFFWDKGSNNDADYFTKHFPAKYHRVKRSRYVQDKLNIIQQRIINHPLPNQVYCEGVLLRSMTS